jgi:hypothetical protein
MKVPRRITHGLINRLQYFCLNKGGWTTIRQQELTDQQELKVMK